MASSSRRSGWIIASALVVMVLTLVAVVLWLWLPRWAPEWVLENSPWFDPAFRAALQTPGPDDINQRRLGYRIIDRSISGG